MPEDRPQVFLDSNVIFSGLHSPDGAPGATLERFVNGSIGVVISRQVLEEVVRTVRAKLPGALPALRRLLLDVPPEVIADPEPREVEGWTGRLALGDAAILAAAAKAGVDCLVTGDKRFTGDPTIAQEAGLRIVTPADFLRTLE